MPRIASISLLASLCCLFLISACKDTKETSLRLARQHVEDLVKVAETDVGEVRAGLPEGAKRLSDLFAKDEPREEKASAARDALNKTREKVQDLRVAKSTFFAVAGVDGVVIRNDQEADRMAGKGLFGAFPKLRDALAGKYVETIGAMEEASGVKGKPDAQWVVAQPVRVGDQVKGLYVTGWSWSAYAYRLETNLRSRLKSDLRDSDKMPLVYVFVVVDRAVYGAPVSPLVSQEEIAKLDPLAHLGADSVFVGTVEITGRGYGLAVKVTPVFGPKVAIAVLRSET
jgi:hypothetical protein